MSRDRVEHAALLAEAKALTGYAALREANAGRAPVLSVIDRLEALQVATLDLVRADSAREPEKDGETSSPPLQKRCPKCNSRGVNHVWHSLPFVFFCSKVLTHGPHLCHFCGNCGYGWLPKRVRSSERTPALRRNGKVAA